MQNKYLPFVLFGCLIIFFVIHYSIRCNKLNENHRYSGGVFYKITASSDGGPLGEYAFTYKNDTIRSNIVLKKRADAHIGAVYLVEFNPENPSNCRIFLNKIIPNQIIIPDSGWLKLPDSIRNLLLK